MVGMQNHARRNSYMGKKALGLICRHDLSNIMSDGIFYDSMGWSLTRFLLSLFKVVIIAIFLSMEDMNSVLSLYQQWTRGYLKL